MRWSERVAAELSSHDGNGHRPLPASEAGRAPRVGRAVLSAPIARNRVTAAAVRPAADVPAAKLASFRVARPDRSLVATKRTALYRSLTSVRPVQLGVVASVPPPARVDPVRVGDVLLFPNRASGSAMFLAAAPVGLTTTISIRSEETDDTVRTTGGDVTIVVTALPVLSDEDIAGLAALWSASLSSAGFGDRSWRFLPLHVRSVRPAVDLPDDQLVRTPTVAAGSDTADAVFVIELNARGAQAWLQAVESDHLAGIVGSVSFDVGFAAETAGQLGTQRHTTSASLGAVVAASAIEHRVIRAEIGVPARLVVSGHPSIERVVLTLNAGDDVQTATFGPDGGEATMALATTATDTEEIRWDGRVSFRSAQWPIIATSGVLSNAAGWSAILAPATWTRTIDVMTVLVDDAGRTVGDPAGAIVSGSVEYNSSALSGGPLHVSFNGEHQQMVSVVLPDPPTEDRPAVELSMMVLRDGAQAVTGTRLQPNDRWVLARVGPDATVGFVTNSTPSAEAGSTAPQQRLLNSLFD